LRANRAALALVLAGALARCAAPPRVAAVRPAPVRADAVLYVIGRGWHTDVGLPVGEIRGPLAALPAQFPGVRYLVFGFGERAYLLSRDKTFAQMVRALFPGAGVMLVTALAAPPEAAFGPGHVIALSLPQAEVDRLADFLWRYLRNDAAGVPAPFAPGPYPSSVFYHSGGTYALGHTCNTWTVEALRAAGMPVGTGDVLFANQVWARARQLAAAQSSASGSRSPGMAAAARVGP